MIVPPFTAQTEAFRAELRAFVQGELRPRAPEWEEARGRASESTA